jgi:cytochrome c-type biogenesis protein CcmH
MHRISARIHDRKENEMTGFLLMTGTLFALALAFVLSPWARQRKVDSGMSHFQSNLLIYRDQLKQLQADRDNGILSAAEFESERAELGKRVLEDALATLKDDIPVNPKSTTGRWAALVVAVLLPASAVGLYLKLGAPALVVPADKPELAGAVPRKNPHGMSFDQIRGSAEELAARLRVDPGDGEGWATLARSFNVLGRFVEAAAAYEKAISLLPADAQLLADYADALAMSQDQKLNGKPLEIIGQALKTDPGNLKALALAGTAAFERKDYRSAIGYWEKVVQNAPADSEFSRSIGSSLEEARAFADGRQPMAALPDIEPAAPAASTQVAGAATLSGTVSLAPQIAAKARPGDTLFIYARAEKGSRMPLAILSKPFRELPMTFTLDDSSAMMPGTKLSGADKVMVVARISRSGNASAQSGDLEGVVGPIHPGRKNIELEVNTVLP